MNPRIVYGLLILVAGVTLLWNCGLTIPGFILGFALIAVAGALICVTGKNIGS